MVPEPKQGDNEKRGTDAQYGRTQSQEYPLKQLREQMKQIWPQN